MKHLIVALTGVLMLSNVFAQVKDPVSWTFNAIKRAQGIYEIMISADVPKPWHMYAQNTPKGGPIPTKVTFNKNPLVVNEGKLVESGKLEKIYDKIFGVHVFYYSGKVTYKQMVRVKAGVSTNLSGTVSYMVCDDEQCLPPTKKIFDIKLQ